MKPCNSESHDGTQQLYSYPAPLERSVSLLLVTLFFTVFFLSFSSTEAFYDSSNSVISFIVSLLLSFCLSMPLSVIWKPFRMFHISLKQVKRLRLWHLSFIPTCGKSFISVYVRHNPYILTFFMMHRLNSLGFDNVNVHDSLQFVWTF
jgi:hypothetical protein